LTIVATGYTDKEAIEDMDYWAAEFGLSISAGILGRR
jgi:hypothetical protein